MVILTIICGIRIVSGDSMSWANLLSMLLSKVMHGGSSQSASLMYLFVQFRHTSNVSLNSWIRRCSWPFHSDIFFAFDLNPHFSVSFWRLEVLNYEHFTVLFQDEQSKCFHVFIIIYWNFYEARVKHNYQWLSSTTFCWGLNSTSITRVTWIIKIRYFIYFLVDLLNRLNEYEFFYQLTCLCA